MKLCVYDHQPPSEFEGLPRGVGGWTIVEPFFEDVEGDNTLGVNREGVQYPLMKQRRDSYELYYDERMSDISDLVDDLNTELSVLDIGIKLTSIANKIAEIDIEYLSAATDIHNLMDAINENLYDDYIIFLES